MMFKKIVRSLSLFVALLSSAVMVASCSAKYTGCANVTNERYSFGTYQADFNASMFNVAKAVRNTCARARLVKRYHDFRFNTCHYLYQDVDGVDVDILLKENNDGSVRLKIYIGKTGDKESSQKLLLAIDDELRVMMTMPER